VTTIGITDYPIVFIPETSISTAKKRFGTSDPG